MVITTYSLGKDPGFRPGTRMYQFAPLVVQATPSPFPRYRPPHTQIRHYTPPKMNRVGPIHAGGATAGLRPLYPPTGSNFTGVTANRTAIERTRRQAQETAARSRKFAETALRAHQDMIARQRRTQLDQRLRDIQRIRNLNTSFNKPPGNPFRTDTGIDTQGRRPPKTKQKQPRHIPAAAPKTVDLRWGGPNGLPQRLPANRLSAPERIDTIPAIMNTLDKLTAVQKSKKGPEQGIEVGAVLVVDEKGIIGYANMQSGVRGLLNYDREVQSWQTVIGTAHIHTTPEKVGFSAVDIMTMIATRDRFSFMIAGDKYLMLMRTEETFGKQISAEEYTENVTKQTAAIIHLINKGYSRERAHFHTCNYLAEKFKLVLYEGDRHEFTKVAPLPPYKP